MSYFPSLGLAGWVGRVPPRIKEFFNPPFLVLKARHLVIQESICYYFMSVNINYVNDVQNLIVSLSIQLEQTNFDQNISK